MAKERAAAVGVADETETPTTTETPTEATPAVAPAPAETTTEEAPEEPAAAARTTLQDLLSLSFDTPEARTVFGQINNMARFCNSFRSNIHSMISAENRKAAMTPGQQMFFISLAQGTWDIQTLLGIGEGILTGQVLVDNEGEVVAGSTDRVAVFPSGE